ncbi:MAG: YqeG family HAD IIIA-type phosphatase [Planctomycetaceae bacterium]|jgi:HAD superfamily phosphatase (TIGR01668 family)|nr:YqeG family HAD IIIA-type phosphatase [Planctomycetaceae bacterium]
MNFLYPHYRFGSIVEISFEWLKEQGLTTLLLDVDSTLKYYSSPLILPEVADWIEQKRACGVRFCLLSNGRQRRICKTAESLNLPYLAPAYKPLPFGCRKAMRQEHFEPRQTALIGDQVFADVMAANLAGIRSILVTPLRPEEEPFFARMKRPLEQLVLNGYERNR